ncbi:phage integrase [Planomonospora venezuelensis]|jgi:integrase|uniref:Tyrosine-type recombinase/integrase n=1 Tax=Nocardioides oceani TaxID=3058369 RepID=A0ABT8FJP7_9ACTN|nr:site-specific integrase [Nocardioides oceani]MDN4174903.1 tyrosine-type recombinase/integrase [Nocardioides oceani]GIM62745.1 phage integrase [Planomonospora venezuelensis]
MARPPLPIGTFGTITTKEVRPGVYRARTRFRDFDGVTREIKGTGRSAAAAVRELKVKIADRSAPSGDLIGPDMRISQVADIWLSLYRAEQRSEATTANEYQRIIENVINPAIGNIRLREATAGRLERLIRSQDSHSRRKKTKTVLKMMFDAAVIDDALPANPVSSTSRLRGQKKDVQALSVEDLNAVRSAVDAWMTKKRPGPKPNQDMPDIVDLLLATGCRIGEVLAIRWTDIDLSATPPTVSISGTIKTETGKGTYRKPKPKSDASKRTIALPPFAVDVLMRRRIEQRPNHYNAVFATRNGTWHQVGNIERRWRTIRADTGFDWVTPHTFRKTVATLIDRLVDSDTAARVLGHSSDAITKEFYIEKDRTTPDVTHILQSFAGKATTTASDD